MNHHRELLQAFLNDLDCGLGVVVSPLGAIELRNALRAALVLTDDERVVLVDALGDYADAMEGVAPDGHVKTAYRLRARLTRRELP
jgi:hypothetical protein